MRDPVKRKSAWNKYSASLKGKASQARFNASPRRNANQAKYDAMPNRKARRAEREALPKGKAANASRCAKRRARKLAATVLLTVQEQARVIALYAEARAMTELTGEPYHVDHKKPLSKGGVHHPDNLQVMLGAENRKKGAKYAC